MHAAEQKNPAHFVLAKCCNQTHQPLPPPNHAHHPLYDNSTVHHLCCTYHNGSTHGCNCDSKPKRHDYQTNGQTTAAHGAAQALTQTPAAQPPLPLDTLKVAVRSIWTGSWTTQKMATVLNTGSFLAMPGNSADRPDSYSCLQPAAASCLQLPAAPTVALLLLPGCCHVCRCYRLQTQTQCSSSAALASAAAPARALQSIEHTSHNQPG